MLRKITRPTVTSKQSIVNDHTNNYQWFSPEKPTKPSSFFFNSTPFFKGFFNYKFYQNQMITPISILEKNPFLIVSNFLVFENKKITQKTQKNHFWEQTSNKKGIVLALIDENNKKNKQKHVVFGPQLRIKLKKSSIFQCFSHESPKEFGIKTPRNKNNNNQSRVHPRTEVAENVSVLMSEIDEKSEDYTCVISHGPNPKTTHIFGNCIVEKCCGKNIVGVNSFLPPNNNNNRKVIKNENFTSFGNLQDKSTFLTLCYYCKKKLGQGKDIYMYRGERAFCSEECRNQEMFFDQVEN